MLLPREHLRLSFLDLHSPYGSFESCRYFESSIKILDLEDRVASRPTVLIARLESDKTVYSLERQENGLYSLCHLGSWVDLAILSELASVSCDHLVKKHLIHATNSGILQPLVTPQSHKENKKRRLAIEAIQSLVKKPARSRSISVPTQSINQSTLQLSTPTGDGQAVPQQDDNASASPVITPHLAANSAAQSQAQAVSGPRREESPAQPTADDIFDNIRNQYLETLYHSMVCWRNIRV